MTTHRSHWLLASLLLTIIPVVGTISSSWADDQSLQYRHVREMVVVPGEDRFQPFELTIHTGETVKWMNDDTDDHTVVSDDTFNTTGPRGFNQLLPGTASTGGSPGTLTLRFEHPGIFVYYCRFHSHLDRLNQPVAPGPDGGIQDENGNFGTPMMGVITVVSPEDERKPHEGMEGKPQGGKSNSS